MSGTATAWPGQANADVPLPTPLRVSGVLSTDARIASTTDGGVVLDLDLQPGRGLPYRARVVLAADPIVQMQAEALLPQLRTGALVSVTGDGLDLCTDHGHALLRVRNARGVLVFFDRQPAEAPAVH